MKRIYLWIVLCSVCISGVAPAGFIGVSDPNDVVATDGACTLREAIDNANLPAGGDTTGGDCDPGDPGTDIIGLSPGSYTISLFPAGEDANAGGDFDILDNLILSGSGAAATAIHGSSIDRVLHIAPNLQPIDVQIRELTISDGALASPGRGGGVMVEATAGVTIELSRVIDSLAEIGGGIYNEGGLHLFQSELRGNRAEFGGDGGGIYNFGIAELDGSISSSNFAENRGGGAYNQGQLTLLNSFVEFNSAIHGAGLFNDGTTEITLGGLSLNTADENGGAIHHAGGSLQIEGATLLNNNAVAEGGGIYSTAGLTLRDTQIRGNEAIRNGGGVFHSVDLLVLVDGFMQQNQAGDDGGGIYNSAAVSMETTQLDNNTAGGRGGGLFNSGDVELSFSELNANLANQGAGIYTQGPLVAEFSLIAGNQSTGQGGGLHVRGGALTTLINSTLSGNTAVAQGGGAYVEGTLQVDFSTIADNTSSAPPGAGLYNSGDVTIKNSIVANNSGADCGLIGLTSFGYNLDSDGSCGLGAGVGDLSGVTLSLPGLLNNGGPTRTHALSLPNPAIDSADPDCTTQFSSVNTLDQRAILRPRDGDGNGVFVCDRGAYEAAAPNHSPPPVPNGIIGTPLIVGKPMPSGIDLELQWDVTVCPAPGYLLIHGPLADVSNYNIGGSFCGLSVSGFDTWINSTSSSAWFLILPNNGAQIEGSWGQSSFGIRNGAVVSNECLIFSRDNAGTCP